MYSKQLEHIKYILMNSHYKLFRSDIKLTDNVFQKWFLVIFISSEFYRKFYNSKKKIRTRETLKVLFGDREKQKAKWTNLKQD